MSNEKGLSVVGKFTTSAHIQSETEDHLELKAFSWWAKVCRRSCNFFLDIECHFKNFVLGFRILLDKAGILHLIWKRWKSCKLYNRQNFMLIGMDDHNPEKSLHKTCWKINDLNLIILLGYSMLLDWIFKTE